MTSPTSNSLPFSFINKKAKILADLSTPVTSYVDASPKGSIDIGIVDLINAINELPEYVTTSSCAGRISVFVEGKKGTEKSENEEGRADGIERESSQSGERETRAGIGGKGGGGKWLYVSHDPLLIRDGQDLVDLLGMARKIEEKEITLKEQRLVRFKFEPMILHILTATTGAANSLVRAGISGGFRESGAINLLPSASSLATPMVAIRSMGLGFESIVGRLDSNGNACCIVSESLLKTLVETANERFKENERRRGRFWNDLVEELRVRSSGTVKGKEKRAEDGGKWEDKNVRRERLRREGLERGKEKKTCENDDKGIVGR